MSKEFEQALEGVDDSRRSFLRKMAIGTAFAAPVVSSFTMTGIKAVYAQTPRASGPAAGSGSASQPTSSTQGPSTTTTSRTSPTTSSTPSTTSSTTTSTTTTSSTTTTTTTMANGNSTEENPG